MDAEDYRFIRYTARAFAKRCVSLTEDDLFQVGVLAYMDGIDKWDPLKGKKWDYMWLVVGGKVASYIRTHDSLIYIPQNAQKYVSYEFEDIDDYDILGEDLRLVEVEDMLYKTRLCDRCLNLLTERERFVIEKRYGLNGSEPQYLEQVGKALGVTRERVRQIEAKALRKMRWVIWQEHIQREDLFDD